MSVYKPAHEPAHWYERWLSHPGEAWLAVLSMVVAVLVAVDPFVFDVGFSRSLGDLPLWVACGIGWLMFGGAVLALWGLLTRMTNRSRAWSMEASGWWLCATGWVGYAVAVIAAYPGSVIAWLSSLTLALIGVSRVLALHFIERDAIRLRAVAQAEVSKAGGGK